jgi:hypothetical protein
MLREAHEDHQQGLGHRRARLSGSFPLLGGTGHLGLAALVERQATGQRQGRPGPPTTHAHPGRRGARAPAAGR